MIAPAQLGDLVRVWVIRGIVVAWVGLLIGVCVGVVAL